MENSDLIATVGQAMVKIMVKYYTGIQARETYTYRYALHTYISLALGRYL